MGQTTMDRPLDLQAPPVTSWRDGFRRTPLTWKLAFLIGTLGWFFSLGASTTTTLDGVASCDGTDIGPLVVAGAVALLAVAGWRRTRQGHVSTRLPATATWLGVGVLAALVAVHVLRVVLAPAGNVC
jgi:uncharacterized membrane protein YidH (DUF202 family)